VNAIDTWTVTPTSVQKNGAPIVGYVAHELLIRNNIEGKPFSEVSIAVRVIDAQSEANREAPLATLPAGTQAIVLGEYAMRPAFTEFRTKPGDIINFSGSYTAGSGNQPASPAGSDLL
jgi:hypothetical protein